MILRNGKRLITYCDQDEENTNEKQTVKKRKRVIKETIDDDPLPLLPACKDLPDDLVIGSILTRLSARTLALCSCVSKLWHNTIYDDKQFATSHFVQNQNKYSLFFTLLNVQRKAFIFGLEEKDNGSNDLDFIEFGALSTSLRNEYELVGYCNGLACFEGVREDFKGGADGVFFVVNPTRDETLCLSYLAPPPGEYIHLCHGFGFDSASGKYKIAVIFTSKANGEFVTKVITLGSNSWRTITTVGADILLRPPGFPIRRRVVKGVSIPSASSTLCGGDLFWKITNQVDGEDNNGSDRIEMLLSFNLHNEKIKFIGLPTEPILRVNEYDPLFSAYHLLEFKGYPCVARFEKIVTNSDDFRCKYLSHRCLRCCCCSCKVHLYILVEHVWIKDESFDIRFNKEGLPTAQLGCYFQTTPPRILSFSNQVLLYWFNGECLILYNLQTKNVQVVKGSRFCPRVFYKLREPRPSIGYFHDPFDFWSIENQLHAQVENIHSLKAFIPPEGAETIESKGAAHLIQPKSLV